MLKEWILIKRGLITSSKHYHRIGVAIWIYLLMLDQVEFETGTVWEWKDEDAARALDMNLATVRAQRRKLVDAGYIVCEQRRHCQEIRLTKWVSPRRQKTEQQGTTLSPKGAGHGAIKVNTLLPYSKIIKSSDRKKNTKNHLEDYLE